MWQLKPYRMWACKSGMARALIAATSVSKGTHSYSSESVAVSVADAEGVPVPTIVPEAPPPSQADLERLYAFVNDRFLPPPLIICRHCCDSLWLVALKLYHATWDWSTSYYWTAQQVNSSDCKCPFCYTIHLIVCHDAPGGSAAKGLWCLRVQAQAQSAVFLITEGTASLPICGAPFFEVMQTALIVSIHMSKEH